MPDTTDLTDEQEEQLKETIDRRNLLFNQMLEYKKKRLKQLGKLMKETEKAATKDKEKAKKKRKADKKARRLNRSK